MGRKLVAWQAWEIVEVFVHTCEICFGQFPDEELLVVLKNGALICKGCLGEQRLIQAQQHSAQIREAEFGFEPR